MANRDFTLKRNTGVDTYDILLPTTHVGQIYTDNTLAVTLQSILDGKINTSLIGANNGVAPLDASGKILISDLPTEILGGLKFVTALTVDTDLDTLGSMAISASAQGSFWIATNSIVLTSSAYSTVLAPGDEGDSSFPITIEAGDWLILTSWATDDYEFAIVNNTYNEATTAAPGIVTLSNTTNVDTASGNKVITDGILAGLMGTTDGTIARGDHTHSGYQASDATLTSIAALNTSVANTTNNLMIYADGNDTYKVAGLHSYSRGLLNNDTAASWRSSLGLVIGTNVQAYDAGLSSIAGLTTDADKMIYTTAADTYAVTALTSSARALLDDTSFSAMRTTLGLAIGTNVQAYDAGLSSIAGLNTSLATDTNSMLIYADGNDTYKVAGLHSYSRGLLNNEDAASWRSSLSVYSESEVDAFFTNRPNIFYDVSTGIDTGDLFIDLD